jgi:hypothetical protein
MNFFPLRIDALLLLYYKKNFKAKKNTKEMDFQINKLLLLFGWHLPKGVYKFE